MPGVQPLLQQPPGRRLCLYHGLLIDAYFYTERGLAKTTSSPTVGIAAFVSTHAAPDSVPDFATYVIFAIAGFMRFMLTLLRNLN
jgi:hypothetical protein